MFIIRYIHTDIDGVCCCVHHPVHKYLEHAAVFIIQCIHIWKAVAYIIQHVHTGCTYKTADHETADAQNGRHTKQHKT